MASNVSVEVYQDSVLGVGSYGKVCKAKYGQLPCAAKLLHETLLEQGGDPGRARFAERFEQECQFLGLVRHPNIVQYLGTLREPRIALLMELMDESLTKLLQRSSSPLPYHIQLNICHDVALALSYLHSNAIIHRDLSSNNVLLIGEGSRAKITDFGMSKLIDANPRMTPLTLCPGTAVYMPPEALTTPPSYSTKLDCFSFGVLTIQTATRRFPTPRDPTITIEDSRYPTGRVVVPVPETERRRHDIDLMERDHPLLPIACQCIRDREAERLSSNEVCERLAMLKLEERMERIRNNSTTPRMQLQGELDSQERNQLEQELAQKGVLLERAQAEKADQAARYQTEIERARTENTALQTELERARAEVAWYQTEAERAKAEKTVSLVELERVLAEKADLATKHQKKLAQLQADHQKQSETRMSQLHDRMTTRTTSRANIPEGERIQPLDSAQLKWRLGKPALRRFNGTAFVHGNNAYFSNDFDIYTFTVPDHTWSRIQPSKTKCFSMAVVGGMLTTIGGYEDEYARLSGSYRTVDTKKNALLSIKPGISNWVEVFPPMPTGRCNSAALTVGNFLVVAGGQLNRYDASDAVEILDANAMQWSTASRLLTGVNTPYPSDNELSSPSIMLCGGCVYIYGNKVTVFSCSVQDLLASASSNSGYGAVVWSRLPEIPDVRKGATLTAFEDHLLAIGGENYRDTLSVIHSYDKANSTWKAIGSFLSPISGALAVLLPNNEVMLTGGTKGYSKPISDTYFGTI